MFMPKLLNRKGPPTARLMFQRLLVQLLCAAPAGLAALPRADRGFSSRVLKEIGRKNLALFVLGFPVAHGVPPKRFQPLFGPCALGLAVAHGIPPTRSRPRLPLRVAWEPSRVFQGFGRLWAGFISAQDKKLDFGGVRGGENAER